MRGDEPLERSCAFGTVSTTGATLDKADVHVFGVESRF